MSQQAGPCLRVGSLLLEDNGEVASLALIRLCQECRRPLAVFEQLVMFPDDLAWPTVSEVCFGCGAEVETGSLRVTLDPDPVML